MHHILFYDVVDDYVERRAQFREAHLKLAREAHGRGELVLGGALADPVDGAVLLFRGESSEAAEAFAKADPYVLSGLVKPRRLVIFSTRRIDLITIVGAPEYAVLWPMAMTVGQFSLDGFWRPNPSRKNVGPGRPPRAWRIPVFSGGAILVARCCQCSMRVRMVTVPLSPS